MVGKWTFMLRVRHMPAYQHSPKVDILSLVIMPVGDQHQLKQLLKTTHDNIRASLHGDRLTMHIFLHLMQSKSGGSVI